MKNCKPDANVPATGAAAGQPPEDLGALAWEISVALDAGEKPPRPIAMPIDVEGLPAAKLRTAHGVLAGAYAYNRMSVSRAVVPTSQHSVWLSMTGAMYVHDFVANVAPRNAIEEAIATQLAVTSGRLNWLTLKLSEAKEDADVARLSLAIDSATNALRRLLTTWHQLRGTAPTAPPAMVVQNNVAQHVVHVAGPQGAAYAPNGAAASSSPTPNPSSNVEKTSDETTLPPQPAGTGSAPAQDRRQPPVEDVHRPADAGGEGPLERQRLQTRRAEPLRCPSTPTSRRRAPAGKRNPPRRPAARPVGDPGDSGMTD